MTTKTMVTVNVLVIQEHREDAEALTVAAIRSVAREHATEFVRAGCQREVNATNGRATGRVGFDIRSAVATDVSIS